MSEDLVTRVRIDSGRSVVNAHGTNATDADSDDGGRTDGEEVLIDGTNPLNPADDIA